MMAFAITGVTPIQASILGGHDRDCIPRGSIRAETAESDNSLIFHAKGGRAYRNTLPAPCDGLKSLNNLGELGLRSKEDDLLCAGDLVWLKTNDLFSAGSETDGDTATCKLGSFEPISEMSLTEFLRR
jgi:hypothetical protein